MRTPQELFKLAIDLAYYKDVNQGSPQFMCCALDNMHSHGLITDQEHFSTKAELNGHIHPHYLVCLVHALRINGLPSAYEDRLTIYLDWANRPVLRLNGVEYE